MPLPIPPVPMKPTVFMRALPVWPFAAFFSRATFRQTFAYVKWRAAMKGAVIAGGSEAIESRGRAERAAR